MRIAGIGQCHPAYDFDGTVEPAWPPGYPQGTTRNTIHRFQS